jgi:hypothetical protein
MTEEKIRQERKKLSEDFKDDLITEKEFTDGINRTKKELRDVCKKRR